MAFRRTLRCLCSNSPFNSLGYDLSPAGLGPQSTKRAIIEGLGPSSLTISGVRVHGSVMILSTISTLWNVENIAEITPESFALVKLIMPKPEVMLIGTGARMVPITRELREFFSKVGVSVDCMDTKNACHTFNVLNQEGRSVAAALLPSAYGDSEQSEWLANIMNKVESIKRLNEAELAQNLAGTSASWHVTYRDCPYVYVGGLATQVTEGDILTMFEQFGTVLMVEIVREENGKSRGFGFVQYEDTRSAVLAVDNFCGVEFGGRILSVDHADNYERRKGRGIDTTPPSESRKVTAVERGLTDREKKIEERREREVMKRLKAMQGGLPEEDDEEEQRADDEKRRESKEEKKRRKREREERKAERARIREERKRRRAERERE